MNRRFWYFIGGLTTAYCYSLYKAKSSRCELLRIGAAGSLTMVICDLSLYSMESVNARSKVLRGENVSFTEMTKQIIKNEGLQGMYKGYSASYYSIIIHGFLYFYVYKALKKKLKERYQPQSSLQSALIYGLAAALAQGVDVFCYPLEMIRIRMLTMNDHYGYKSVSDSFRNIIS
jgi:hypothetical protein